MAHAAVVDRGTADIGGVDPDRVDLGTVVDGCCACAGLALMSRPCVRRMRSGEQRPDVKACRNNAGERTGEGGDLDGTTWRRGSMSQYQFLSRFVALAVDQPAMPIGEAVKGATLDLTPAWQCRVIPFRLKGVRLFDCNYDRNRAAQLPPIGHPLALRYAARFAIRTAIFKRAAQRGSTEHLCAPRRAR